MEERLQGYKKTSCEENKAFTLENEQKNETEDEDTMGDSCGLWTRSVKRRSFVGEEGTE